MSSGGFSAERLRTMHRSMSGYVERGEVPGLVGLVSRRGEVHVEAIGSQSTGGHAIKRNSIFRISSMTKPLTAVATMILVEEGLLRLDEPVDRLLPELADRQVLKAVDGPIDQTVPAVRPITVRDLLTFTMGMGYLFSEGPRPIDVALEERGLAPGPPRPHTLPAPDEYMRRLGSLPLTLQPGAAWLYNTGSEVLGVLVARASGKQFDTFLKERIFEPLGMDDTGFFVPSSGIGRLTTTYARNPQTSGIDVFDAAEKSDWAKAPAFPAGAGGLVSTVDDYMAFAEMLLGNGSRGGRRILSRPSVELMTTDQLSAEQKSRSGFGPDSFSGHGWGFGLSVVTERVGLASIGSYGWDGGLGSTWENDPREEMIT
ncbi:MAG TPA: serine hydrolase domain-containing protein, partial [Candidatus Sulfotelmatobacter sp.]|nr:serine hydrolase domain-containing protein [Candidatus Sulfotelmatobacter sp.]